MGDLWSQVGILDLGERLETSLTRFRDKYMMPDQMNRHTHVVYSWKLKENADTTIKTKLLIYVLVLKLRIIYSYRLLQRFITKLK